MQVVTVFFPSPERLDIYDRQLKAFLNSCKVQEIYPLVIRMDAPTPTRNNPAYDYNHAKLIKWVEAYHASDDGVILMDCDMIALKDFTDAFDLVENVGICERPKSRLYFNGGFIVARKTDKTTKLLDRWLEIDTAMLKDVAFHYKYHHKYQGMNQTSFGYLVEHGETEGVVERIPHSYNYCLQDSEWINAHVVHLKANTRRVLEKVRSPTGPHMKAICDKSLYFENLYE